MTIVNILKEGAEWNPLYKLPRNMLCPCGEYVDGKRKKLKNCCLVDAPRAVSKIQAEQIRLFIKVDMTRTAAGR